MLRVLVLLVLFVATTAWGQVAAPDISASQLDAAVERVTESLPEDDPQRASLLKSYADTRAALLDFEQFEQALKSFSLSRANAANEARSIEAGLAQSQEVPAPDDKTLGSVSLPELEQMIQVDKAERDARKSRLRDTRAAIDAMSGRPAKIRERVTELAAELAEVESQLASENKVESGSVEEAALWLAQAQFASASAEEAALDEELLSQPMRLDLLKAQLDQTSYKISVLEKHLQAMALRADELRQGEAAQAQAEAEQVLAGMQGKHELVQRLADKNAGLTESFSERSDAIEKIRSQEVVVRKQAEQLETGLKSIEHKLDVLGMSTAVGEILREQQARLPGHRESARQISVNAQNITTSSMRQVELEDERRQLRDSSKYIAGLVQGVELQTVALISDDLKELVRTRRELMAQAATLENTYAQAVGDFDFTLRRYAVVTDHYRDFISERLLWIPSRDIFSMFRGTDMLTQVSEVFAPGRWLVVLQAMPMEMLAQPLIGVAILLVLVLIYYSSRLTGQLAATGKQVGYVRSDHFSSTLHALGLSLLLSVKWPLLMFAVAWLFEMQESESELATALYTALVRTTLYFWGLEFLRIVLLPKGLVDAHFRWPTSRTSRIGHRVVSLERMLLPAAFFVGFFLNLYPREVGGPLGALAVVLVLLSIAHFFRHMPPFFQDKMQMMFRHEASIENPFWGKLIRMLLFWIPIASILAVLLGYTYTAIEFALILIETMILFSVVLMVHELGLRWLHLTRRRMAFKMRQGQVKASNEDSETSIEDELLEHDPDLLNDEGTKLLNVFTIVGSLLGVIFIWSEILPALGILDSVELWHQTGVVDGLEAPVPVTLGDLFEALAITIVGWVALRRIPSLLEILLRQRANVRPASAYAATRVFQYAATALLVVFVMGSLGGSWSSMQWAVAALSLGIGFGLQEIVANFISGLIILFEQPIRVGDIVTVGEVSGTVTRIQMRATTIRDFDRRELLVPNKEFITNQLLNWSLSDPVNRRLVEVGVAYGTDMDQALAIVREVAMKHPLVLADPQPMITFDEFGDNSLLIKLRFFMGQLEQRLITDSELRLEINRRFNEAGIVVAFPQRDIHFDTDQPLAVKMVKNDPGS